jgi:hypothetical protein
LIVGQRRVVGQRVEALESVEHRVNRCNRIGQRRRPLDKVRTSAVRAAKQCRDVLIRRLVEVVARQHARLVRSERRFAQLGARLMHAAQQQGNITAVRRRQRLTRVSVDVRAAAVARHIYTRHRRQRRRQTTARLRQQLLGHAAVAHNGDSVRADDNRHIAERRQRQWLLGARTRQRRQLGESLPRKRRRIARAGGARRRRHCAHTGAQPRHHRLARARRRRYAALRQRLLCTVVAKRRRKVACTGRVVVAGGTLKRHARRRRRQQPIAELDHVAVDGRQRSAHENRLGRVDAHQPHSTLQRQHVDERRLAVNRHKKHSLYSELRSAVIGKRQRKQLHLRRNVATAEEHNNAPRRVVKAHHELRCVAIGRLEHGVAHGAAVARLGRQRQRQHALAPRHRPHTQLPVGARADNKGIVGVAPRRNHSH